MHKAALTTASRNPLGKGRLSGSDGIADIANVGRYGLSSDLNIRSVQMRWALLPIGILSAQAAFARDSRCDGAVDLHNPSAGVVSDQIVAKSVANAYLTAVYGAEEIRGEQPLRARLSKGVWTVEGVLPRGFKGGVAVILICQRNGRVLSITHGE